MKVTAIALVLFLSMAGVSICADEPSHFGTYISKQDSKEYLTLDPNGNFVLKQRKVPPDISDPFAEVTGRYTKIGDEITLKLANGGEATGTLKGNTFQDTQGTAWVKQGTEPFELKRGKKIKFR